MQDTPLEGTEKELIQGSMGGMVEVISDYRNHRNAIGYSFRFYCTALMKNFHVNLLAVNGIAPDKTVVIVTHRPAALEICDRVIDFTNITDHPERA